MKKIFAILLIATLCIMNASLAFATEATSLHASDDIVSEIQMDISSAINAKIRVSQQRGKRS